MASFTVIILLVVVGFYLAVWILSKMPKPIQEVVRDAIRFLLKGE